MRRPFSLAALLTLAIFALGVPANGAEFSELVRELNSFQNRMAMGDDKAKAATTRQFDLIEQSFASLDPEIWKDEKNVRAAAVYLLCGGVPANLRKIYDARLIPEETAPLLNASLAYAEGGGLAAAKLLAAFEARGFPPVLGGHLALVQGGSSIGIDNPRAVSLLDLARLLMPASLVEEAALRREITILDPIRDGGKLLLLGRHYVAKYLASPYAKNFLDQFRETIIAGSSKMDKELLTRFEALLDKSSPADKTEFYLTLARKAILTGHPDSAAAKIAKAELVAQTPAARDRLKFYRSAVKALDGDLSQGLAELQRLEKDELPRADKEALKIVSSVLTRLDAPPAAVERVVAARTPPRSNGGAGQSEADEPPIVAVARQALDQSEALLRRASKP